MKAYKFFADLCLDEERVLCFLCTRRLRPIRFDHIVNAVLFRWIRRQYTVSFVRPTDGEDGEPCDDSCSDDCQGQSETVIEITVCQPCGMWAHEHPVEGELLAKTRIASLQSGK